MNNLKIMWSLISVICFLLGNITAYFYLQWNIKRKNSKALDNILSNTIICKKTNPWNDNEIKNKKINGNLEKAINSIHKTFLKLKKFKEEKIELDKSTAKRLDENLIIIGDFLKGGWEPNIKNPKSNLHNKEEIFFNEINVLRNEIIYSKKYFNSN